MGFCGLRSVKPTPSGLPPESLSGKGYVLHSRALCQSWISVSTPFSGRFIPGSSVVLIASLRASSFLVGLTGASWRWQRL